MKNLHWVIQKNLGNMEDSKLLEKACKEIDVQCTMYDRIPFSKDLPKVPTGIPTIFYGSVRFVNLCFEAKKWQPAAFFHTEKFKVSYWGKEYGSHWFNNTGIFTTISEFCLNPYDRDQLFFVRPDKDLKEFTGGVWSFGEIQRWKNGLLATDLGEEQLLNTPIFVSAPFGISKEWRLFMIDGMVCQASQYKDRGKLDISSNVPDEVFKFGEDMADLFSPHRFFVLDVCQSNDYLYVLEIGCVNSAGFYACDIGTIVKEISLKILEDSVYENI